LHLISVINICQIIGLLGVFYYELDVVMATLQIHIIIQIKEITMHLRYIFSIRIFLYSKGGLGMPARKALLARRVGVINFQ